MVTIQLSQVIVLHFNTIVGILCIPTFLIGGENMDNNKKETETLYLDVDDFFKNKKIDVNIIDDNNKKVGDKDDDRKKITK